MHLHKWSKWSHPVTDEVTKVKYQWRSCMKCGLVKSRKLKKSGVSDEQIKEALTDP